MRESSPRRWNQEQEGSENTVTDTTAKQRIARKARIGKNGTVGERKAVAWIGRIGPQDKGKEWMGRNAEVWTERTGQQGIGMPGM